MSYVYLVNVITTDKAVGNLLAEKFDPDAGGGSTFTRAVPCYPAGTTFQTSGSGPIKVITPSQAATAWAIAVPMTARGHALAAEFLSAGPWPQLNAIGLTDGQIGYAKGFITAQLGDRVTLEGTLPQFIAANGYTIP